MRKLHIVIYSQNVELTVKPTII